MKRFELGAGTLAAWGAMSFGVFAADPPGKAPAPVDPSRIAAQIGGVPVTVDELDAAILRTNMKLAQSLFDARKAALDQIILNRAYEKDATAKGMPVEQFIKELVTSKAKPVADAEIDAFYKSNSGRMQGKPLDQVSPQIRGMLTSQNENTARQELVTEAKAKAQVKITLEPPRVDVAVAPNDPIKGPKVAKVTIVAFSDFQ